MAKLDPKPYPMIQFGGIHDSRICEEISKKQDMIWQQLEREDDKAAASGSLVGSLVTFPVADGRACYRVTKIKPLTLQHIPISDAYQIPDAHMRGLTEVHIRRLVIANRTLRKLFNEGHPVAP